MKILLNHWSGINWFASFRHVNMPLPYTVVVVTEWNRRGVPNHFSRVNTNMSSMLSTPIMSFMLNPNSMSKPPNMPIMLPTSM